MKTYTLFTASWCGPCKELKSWMITKDINLTIVHINIDHEPQMAMNHHVEKVPTLSVQTEGCHSTQLLEGREQIKPYLEHINGKSTVPNS